MVKLFKITKNQYIGLFALGIAFWILQFSPYIIMPLIPMESNVIMEVPIKSMLLKIIEWILGVSCLMLLFFLVRGDAKWFSLNTMQEKVFFSIALTAILIYFVGWVFYFKGFHSLPFMLITLVAMPPIYYAFLGLWRRNYVLAIVGGLFLIAHTLNVWNNFR